LKPDPYALILGADEGKGACLLQQLAEAFDATLGFTAGDEVP